MAEIAPDIARNPDAIWLSPICDDTAHHGEGRTWAAPAPADTCEDCSEPWVRYVREDLATPAPDSEKLREALTPSGATKAAYLGEFKFDVMFPSLDEDDDEPVPHPVTVPWDTIKEIMAAIANRAAPGESL